MSSQELLAQIDGAELTDDQLEMIAGGNKEDKIVDGCVMTIGVASTIIGATAAAASI